MLTWYVCRTKWFDQKANKSRCLIIKEAPRQRKRTDSKTKQPDRIWQISWVSERQVSGKNEPLQDTDNKPLVRSNMIEQAPNNYNIQEIENSTFRVPSGHFQAKANLQTSNVSGCYYNTQSRVTFDCPWDTQSSCEEKSDQKYAQIIINTP